MSEKNDRRRVIKKLISPMENMIQWIRMLKQTCNYFTSQLDLFAFQPEK